MTNMRIVSRSNMTNKRIVDRSGAVSTTGHGESITKVCLAHRVVQDMQENPANKVFLLFKAFVLYIRPPVTKVRVSEVNISSTSQLARAWLICRAGLEEVGALLLLMSLEGGHLLVQLVQIISFIVIQISLMIIYFKHGYQSNI